MRPDNAERWAEKAELLERIKRLEATNSKLSHEVFELRMSRESLCKALHESREREPYLSLPHPHEVKQGTWEMALRVGREPLLLRDAPFDSWADSHHYRLVFTREYGRGGDFWRLQPFSTEPRR